MGYPCTSRVKVAFFRVKTWSRFFEELHFSSKFFRVDTKYEPKKSSRYKTRAKFFENINFPREKNRIGASRGRKKCDRLKSLVKKTG